jgi:hypothetical protein
MTGYADVSESIDSPVSPLFISQLQHVRPREMNGRCQGARVGSVSIPESSRPHFSKSREEASSMLPAEFGQRYLMEELILKLEHELYSSLVIDRADCGHFFEV